MRHFSSALLLGLLLVGGPAGSGMAAEPLAGPSSGPSLEEQALRLAAENGDMAAQYGLAVALLQPIPPHSGPIKEGAEAAGWLEKSANQGNMDAAFLLGYIHQYGTGVAKNPGAALPWLTKAADAGNVSALITLATVYKVGDGVVKDKIKARDYYAKAAEKGNSNARAALAAMYMDGDGVHKDGKLALGWLKPAVREGHGLAMLSMGTLYSRKDLGMVNGPKAFYWTHQAVAHGYAPAVYALGVLYRDGAGTVAPDPYKAYLWLKLTYELSKPHTTEPYWMENAARALTPEQRKKADADLADWLQKGPPAPPAKEPQ